MNRILSDPTPISLSSFAALLDSCPWADVVGDNGCKHDADDCEQRPACEADSCVRWCVGTGGLTKPPTIAACSVISCAGVANNNLLDHFPMNVIIEPTLVPYERYNATLPDMAEYVPVFRTVAIGNITAGCSYSHGYIGNGSVDDCFVDGRVDWGTPSFVDAIPALPAPSPAFGGRPSCLPARGVRLRGADGIPSDGEGVVGVVPSPQRSCRDALEAEALVVVPISRSRKRRARAKRVRQSLRELVGTSLVASCGRGSVRVPSAVVPCGLSSEHGRRMS